MKRLLIDNNILLDVLAQRELFYKEASELFSLADTREFEMIISSLTFANTHYVLSKLKSEKEAGNILKNFKVIVEVAPLTDKLIELSLNNSKIKDFEDGLQYYTAIENNCEIIITRNLKDFKFADIPVMTAKEFLKSL